MPFRRDRTTCQTRNVISWSGSATPREPVRPRSAATVQASPLKWSEFDPKNTSRPSTSRHDTANEITRNSCGDVLAHKSANALRKSTFDLTNPMTGITSHDSTCMRMTGTPAKKTVPEGSDETARKDADKRKVTAWGHDNQKYRAMQRKFDKLHTEKPDFMKKVEKRKSVLQYGREQTEMLKKNTEANPIYIKAHTGSIGDTKLMSEQMTNHELFNNQHNPSPQMARLSTPKRIVRNPTSHMSNNRKPSWR